MRPKTMQPTETGDAAMQRPRHGSFRRFGPLAAVALALALFFALGGPKHVTLEALAANRAALTRIAAEHPLLAPLGLAAIYALLVAISFPGASLLTIFAGFMFGTLVGGAAIVVGATLGATAIFLVARTAFGDALTRRAGPFLGKLRAGFEANAASYMLVLRLTPVFPFWLVNIAPALFNVPLRTFVITTFIGIIPGTFVFASVGAGAGTVLDAGRTLDLSGVLLKPEILAPIAGLILLSLIPIVLKRRSGRHG